MCGQNIFYLLSNFGVMLVFYDTLSMFILHFMLPFPIEYISHIFIFCIVAIVYNRTYLFHDLHFIGQTFSI